MADNQYLKTLLCHFHTISKKSTSLTTIKKIIDLYTINQYSLNSDNKALTVQRFNQSLKKLHSTNSEREFSVHTG